MVMSCVIRLMLALWLLPAVICAQNLEAILETFEDDEISELEELLRSLMNSPYPINHAPLDSLQSLWFLDAEHIEALSELQQRLAPNISYAHIAAATELPDEIVRSLFAARESFEYFAAARTRIVHKKAGWQYNLRAEFETENLAAGFLSERDPGEPRFADFMAGYLQVAPFAGNARAIFGQFVLQSGAGLLFAGPYGSPALSQPAKVVRFAQPNVRPYRSATENLAFHGVAVSIPLSRFQWIAMLSSAGRDANITSGGLVTSLPIDGVHVSESQLAARNAMSERSIGSIFNFDFSEKISFNLNVLQQHYSHSLAPPDTVRQRYDFRGDRRTFYSAATRYHDATEKVQLIGEIATDGKATAGLLSLLWKLKPLQLSSAYWHAGPDFQNSYGALPGNRVGETDNETAFYLGLQSRLGPGVLLVYNIRRRSVWRTYFQPQPVSRQDFGLQWQQRIGAASRFLFRLRYRQRDAALAKQANSFQPAGETLASEIRFGWRLQFRTRLHEKVNYRVRLDGISFQFSGHTERGTVQTHEIKLLHRGFRATLRYAFYATGGFDTRIYQFEPALPGYMLPGALFGTGERFFATAAWKPSARVQFSGFFRYDQKLEDISSRALGLQINLQNK